MDEDYYYYGNEFGKQGRKNPRNVHVPILTINHEHFSCAIKQHRESKN